MTAARNQYLTLTVVLFVLGVLGSMAYRSTAATSSLLPIDDRHNRMVTLVEDLERERAVLQDELLELRADAAEYEMQQAARSGLDRSYTVELDDLTMLAGLRVVQGPGLRVTLGDSQSRPEGGAEPADYIIHDYDLRALVNALWAGRAEAVSVNGQRLTSSSAIRCVGPTILVNSTRVGSPFVVTAIGEPDRLRGALERDTETDLLLNTYVERYSLQLDIDDGDEFEVPAYAGSLAPRELRALPGSERGRSRAFRRWEGHGVIYLPVLGLLLGIVVGYVLQYDVPPEYARYLSVAVLAALDSTVGGVRAMLERTFRERLFVTGFISNVILAALITFLGDRLGVDLYLAAIVAFGVRIFQNAAVIRHRLIK